MIGREQLFCILRGEKMARPPFWLLFPYDSTPYYVDVRNHEGYRPIHELAIQHGVTLNRRSFYCPFFDESVVETSEEIRLGKMCLVRKGKKLLETDEDLDSLIRFPILADKDRIYAHLESQMPKYFAEKAAFPREAGAMMLDLGEPINFIYSNSNLESLAIWSLTAPEKIKILLDSLMARYRIIYQFCIERKLAEVYFLVGSELASPPMFSVETFCSWIVPYSREITTLVHSGDAYVIEHYHGQIRAVLPHLRDIGSDAIHTIESPPIGNCTIEEAFDIVQDKTTLIGNIQYDEFRSLSPEKMKTAVRSLRERVGSRRFILSPTAGPFDPHPSQHLLDNYRAFIEAAIE